MKWWGGNAPWDYVNSKQAFLVVYCQMFCWRLMCCFLDLLHYQPCIGQLAFMQILQHYQVWSILQSECPIRIPRRPPFTAYIANLPYDVDEGQVQEVFERARLKVGIIFDRKKTISDPLRMGIILKSKTKSDHLRSRKYVWWRTRVEDWEDMATQTLRTGTAWLVDFVVTINSPNILLFQNKQKSIVQINVLSIFRCHNKKSKYFVVSKRKGRIIRFF